MTIADLLINIGVKGAQKTGEALDGVRKGLSKITDISLESKAAIVGAVYALERLMSNSAKSGQGLVNFAASTGLSIKSLQQLQYAASQAGVSAEETEGSITSLQSAMVKMQMGQGRPSGLAFVVNQTGMQLDDKHLKDTYYVFDKVVEYIKNSKDAQAMKLAVAESFGFSKDMFAAAQLGKLDQSVRNRAPLYSDGEVKQLDRVASGWANFGKQWEMIVGKLNAKHGLGMVNDLSKVSTEVGKLVEQFARLAENLKTFKLIGKVFEGWKLIFEELNTQLDKFNAGMDNARSGKKSDGIVGEVGSVTGAFMDFLSGNKPQFQGPAMGFGAGVGIGKVQPKNTTTSMNVQIHNNGVEGADEIADHFDRSVNFAFRQIQSMNQVS